MRMDWIAVLFRKCQLARLKLIDMKSLRREFTLFALTVLLSGAFAAGQLAAAQHGQAPVVADVNVSADDLLTQPPGTNWTSYNGDYTGRRYSGLHEITPQNV